MKNYYPDSPSQSARLIQHPRISAGFAIDKGLWDGREVGVICISRGDYRHRTQRRVYYGTLVLTAGDANQIGVRHRNGEVSILHKNRAVDIYDLTRTKES